MALGASLARLVASLLIAGLASACEGKTLDESRADSGVATDSGIATGAIDSGSGVSTTEGDAGCIDLQLVSSDLSCGSDSDCDLVVTGEICNYQCLCGDTPANAAAAARLQSETASLTLYGCECPIIGVPSCLGGQCTLCAVPPNEFGGCGDAGITTIEDGGTAVVDGGKFDTGTDGAMEGGDSAATCSATNFCACTNFCVSTCRCDDGGCPLTQACGGAVCPNSCPSGEACAVQPGDVYMCSPTCTPDGIDGQGSCSAGMTCQTVCT
jgi:hypothetical protein